MSGNSENKKQQGSRGVFENILAFGGGIYEKLDDKVGVYRLEKYNFWIFQPIPYQPIFN